jgi:hypothetical protein
VDLVKTDLQGRVLKAIDVATHHGDCTWHEDRLYVAVNFDQFNQPPGAADNSIIVYDAQLTELARHPAPEVVHGAGGIAQQGGNFFVVGGLPGGVEENYVYEYDSAFRFLNRHVLASGWTRLGIQTAEYDGQRWYFGCYVSPPQLLIADKQLNFVSRHDMDAALGIVHLGEGRLLVARGARDPQRGYTAGLLPARFDATDGLRVSGK